MGPVAPEPRHSPGSRHTSIFPTQMGRRRLAKCKGVAKGTATKRSWDSNPVKCTQPRPHASKKLLDWIFFFFLKIQRNKRGGGEKKKKMFFFFTLDDYLKSPCSFAHRCPLLWNVRSLKGPCCWSPHTQPLDTQETAASTCAGRGHAQGE